MTLRERKKNEVEAAYVLLYGDGYVAAFIDKRLVVRDSSKAVLVGG